MTKNTEGESGKTAKLNIQNQQIAKAVNLKGIKEKLSKKKASEPKEHPPAKVAAKKGKEAVVPEEQLPVEQPKIKARSRSAFEEHEVEVPAVVEEVPPPVVEEIPPPPPPPPPVIESPVIVEEVHVPPPPPPPVPVKKEEKVEPKVAPRPQYPPRTSHPARPHTPARPDQMKSISALPTRRREGLGPTGRHISDLLPKPAVKQPPKPAHGAPRSAPSAPVAARDKEKFKEKTKTYTPSDESEERKAAAKKAANKGSKFKEFRDMKAHPLRAPDASGGDEFVRYRKKRPKIKEVREDTTIRPTHLKIRIPITIKDLAVEMKLKSSQLIAKFLENGTLVTINTGLEDETAIQLIGQEFGCEILVDTSEEERIRITDKTIQEEIGASNKEDLVHRAPIVTFMGHVDHGKTSLIDRIRSSNIAAGEAGAITQHIGAFRCHTKVGDIAILDTPGHEAFSAMRSRGANVTDIVVLVVAGDEGIRQQTIEALEQARTAGVTIVVAINKCDKPNFDAEKVYRQLADQNLLPEVWGGQTLTINCSAKTGEGIETLLEMLALQAEVLELKSNLNARARGTVLESEMHKGLGTVATVLVQNGTLKSGDSIVVDCYWGRVKTMRDEHAKQLKSAGPSTPVEITGLSGIPEAGQEFVVVATEKEAREIAEKRQQTQRQRSVIQKKTPTLESMLQDAKVAEKKVFNVVLCADMQGSLEALKTALKKIQSDKVDLCIVAFQVGEVSESNIQLAAASNATVIGFHTKMESHAEPLTKQLKVTVKFHDIIYHAVDDVREMMRQTLDKIAVENDRGVAEVRQTFKSSHLGIIAGCYVTDGSIMRSHHIRVKRGGEQIWKGPIASLKRLKEDVKEVKSGHECGILLQGFTNYQINDRFEAFEISYLEQDL